MLPKGLGTRHASVAGITRDIPAVRIVLFPERGKDLRAQGEKDYQDYYREGMNLSAKLKKFRER